jgi:antitoxin component YwqK of YwqJK toxin-antitoxin module
VWRIWNTTGTQTIVETFSDNVLDGEFIQYVDKVKLVCGNYKLGKKIGMWTFSYPNGVKYAEGQFIDDQRMGCWIEWHPNGVKASESDYFAGYIVGRILIWNQLGVKIRDDRIDTSQ